MNVFEPASSCQLPIRNLVFESETGANIGYVRVGKGCLGLVLSRVRVGSG